MLPNTDCLLLLNKEEEKEENEEKQDNKITLNFFVDETQISNKNKNLRKNK